MADRSVSVFLKANVAGYQAAMQQAKLSTQDFAKTAQASATKHRQDWDRVGKGMLVTGGVIAAGMAMAVKANMDFEKQLSAVRAASNATAGDMDKLRKAALKAGADTAFSASDAARAETELAKVGISTSDILGGALSGSLSLAAAGQLELGRSAEISGQAMKIFNMQGKDVGHIADVLSAGANKSAADVEQLAQAMSQAGLVASQTGLGLEDTVGVLSAFADNALMGSDAGTSLKTMLQRLTPQSAEAQAMMDKLGLSAYDSGGNFVGLSEYAGQLQAKLGTMTTEQRNAAMSVLFGSDAVRAANVLYKLGAEGVSEYTAAVNDQGAAARTAAIQMDNLAGDFEQLKGSVETGLIQGGSAANDTLRSLTQSATGAVNAFTSMPEGAQKAVFAAAGVTAAVLVTGGALATLVPRAIAAKASLETLGVSGARASKGLKMVGVAGAAFAGMQMLPDLFLALDKAMGRVPDNADDLRRSLHELGSTGAATGAITKTFGADFSGVAHRFALDTQSLGDAVDRLTVGNFFEKDWSVFGKSIEAENIEELDKALTALAQNQGAQEAQNSFNAMAQAAGLTGTQVDRLKSLMPGYTGALADATRQQQETAGSAQSLAVDGFDQVTGRGEAMEEQIKATTDALKGMGDAFLTEREASRGFQEAIDDAAKAVKSNGTTLDETTEKGRANARALDDMAQKGKDLREAVLAQSGPGKRFQDTLSQTRGSLVRAAERFGMTRSAARRYADSILAIPKSRTTNVSLNGASSAISRAGQIAAAIARIPGRKTTDVVVRKIGAQYDALVGEADGGTVDYFAKGSEKHVAQIAPAGSWRVWAEPETGGEAYIPLAPAKRERSKDILDSVAARFGAQVTYFANGGGPGFVAADWSAITSRMPTNAPTAADIRNLARAEADGDARLAAAKRALLKVERDRHHTAKQMADAKGRVAVAQRAENRADEALYAGQRKYAAARAPYATRFHSAARASNAATARFIKNVDILRKRGFGTLADQLTMQADGEAYALAAAAVKSAKTARTLSADVAASAKNQRALDTRQETINNTGAAQTPAATATPAWSLPVSQASTYGARPSQARLQSVVVKIGDRELTNIVSAEVDGQLLQVVNGLIYGG